MDASPLPRRKIRLLLDMFAAQDGRVEGRISIDGTGTWTSFSGVLELLKVLEETGTEEGTS